jgi:hypothetical protein
VRGGLGNLPHARPMLPSGCSPLAAALVAAALAATTFVVTAAEGQTLHAFVAHAPNLLSAKSFVVS